MEIADTSVLLTGATGGIGHAIARRIHREGGRLTLTGRRTEVLEALAAETGARSLAVDLSRREEVDRLIAEAAYVDILIANAALPATGTVESFSIEQLDRVLDVNLRAPIVMARALSEHMRQRGSGHLVFIASLAGKASSPRSSMYNATKFGLRGFAHALRADLHGTGVGVSIVSPGFVSDAGLFADAGVELPRGVGTRTPEQVADAVVSVIVRDRAEVDVAPLMVRGLTAFASLAPGIAATMGRRMGAEKLSDEMAAAQTDKR
jgi:short-subunit dehydrogenase